MVYRALHYQSARLTLSGPTKSGSEEGGGGGAGLGLGREGVRGGILEQCKRKGGPARWARRGLRGWGHIPEMDAA